MRHHPDAIVHRAELREKTPEESQEAGQEESQQDVDADEDMRDAYPSPRKRRRSVSDDLPGEDVDHPRHRSGGSSFKRTKSFRKRPRAFPMAPLHPSSSSSGPPPPTSPLPTSSPRPKRGKKWQPAAFKSPDSDSDNGFAPISLQPVHPKPPLRRSPPVSHCCVKLSCCLRLRSVTNPPSKISSTRTKRRTRMMRMYKASTLGLTTSYL